MEDGVARGFFGSPTGPIPTHREALEPAYEPPETRPGTQGKLEGLIWPPEPFYLARQPLLAPLLVPERGLPPAAHASKYLRATCVVLAWYFVSAPKQTTARRLPEA